MAHVHKIGRYWYIKYYDHSGKQRKVKGYTDKAKSDELARRLDDESRAIKLGDVDPQAEARRVERSKPIGDHLADFKAKMQAKGCTDNHVSYTVADVEKLVAFGGIKSASEITWGLVDKWVLSLKSAKVDANKTINRRVSSVQQFLRHLSEVGGVSSYVLLRYPKLPTGEGHRKRVSRALVNGEVGKLLGVSNLERRQLYTFALKTGLRLSECRQMEYRYIDLDPERPTLNIPAHIAKAKRDQSIPLHPALVDMLKTRSEGLEPDARIFSNMPTKQHVNNQLRADCKEAGIPVKDVSFHSLRHTFCTLLARKAHPALLRKLARHSDVKTTLKYYVHLQRDDEQAAIASI